jgi:predicted transcriptional regulator
LCGDFIRFKKLILKDKQAKVLMYMRTIPQGSTISNISKNCEITYVHTINFINRCTKLGIVSDERHGRIKEIKLTEKGTQLADLIIKVDSFLKDNSIEELVESKDK